MNPSDFANEAMSNYQNPKRMKTDREKIKVMLAHIAGKKIEAKLHHICTVDSPYSDWKHTGIPEWNWTYYDYRVAREPRTVWVNEYLNCFGTICDSKEEADACNSSNLRAGRIRRVKFVEVIEEGQ